MKSNTYNRYLPSDQQAKGWGWRLVNAGRQFVSKNEIYPMQAHPKSYLFKHDGTRILKKNEFQIIYIIKGSGTFESKSLKKTDVYAGDALLLFPNEWHSYKPNKKTGWSEYWVGFSGHEAARIIDQFITIHKPIIKVNNHDLLIQQYERILEYLNKPIAGKKEILASFLPTILAILNSSAMKQEPASKNSQELIILAKSAMTTDLSQPCDIKKIAQNLGLSYSNFRNLFKKHTGHSPQSYFNILRLNKACQLMENGGLSISETSEALNYSSVYYFSRAFKKHFTLPPKQWLAKKKGSV